ncbi:MAG: TrkH family potassium uptake protein [Alphaproteobacteria bacterium]|nr:TrkH family potassium uptake protein [Alphaproteobacteria bacterium]
MRFGLIFAINARMLICCGMLMMVPALMDLFYQHDMANAFTLAGGFTLAVGFLLYFLTPKEQEPLYPKEMFLTTTLMWLLYALFAAIPFYLPPNPVSFANAFFESVSGLTTTGASIFSTIDKLSPGTLFWRSMTQWFGGIGIIVVALVVLPALRIGGMQLFATESVILSERISPTVRKSVRDILIYFVLLTMCCGVCLWVAGMGVFDAINHAMTTMATGGFSTHDESIAYYQNTSIEWVLIGFMFLAGLPLVIGPHIFHKQFSSIKSNVQIMTFVKGIIISIVILGCACGWQNVRLILFQVVSIMTTTGFVVSDYNVWGPVAIAVFMILLVSGACTGSTSGGIKMFRFAVVGRILVQRMKSLVQPHAVFVARYGEKVIDTDIVDGVLFFCGMFCITVICSVIALSALDLDYMTALSGTLTCVSNVGPALGNVIGPTQSFENLPDAAKWILSADMLLGRLEFTSIVVLFLPFLWRKNV